MSNNVTSTRGIRLKYKDHYVQAVILPDGRKLVITGTSYGAGAPISSLSEIAVTKKSDLTWVVKDLTTWGYQEVNGSQFYEDLKAIDSTLPWD